MYGNSKHAYFSARNPFSRCSISMVSLSTLVLNSRDWYKIIWLTEILHFKNQPCNRLYPKNRLECIGKAVMMLYLG